MSVDTKKEEKLGTGNWKLETGDRNKKIEAATVAIESYKNISSIIFGWFVEKQQK